MDLEKKMYDQCLLLRLRGELDHHQAGKLREQIDRSLEELGARDLVLNLDGLSFMDSAGVGVLLGRYRRLAQKGGRMALCRVSPAVKKVLEISGVQKLIPFYESEAEAFRHLALPVQRRLK